MKNIIKSLMSVERNRKSTIQNRTVLEEFYSDHSRIIYSSAFRMLQQKAQVFPMDLNKSIRTRMTHSIEVADIGRTLTLKILKELSEKNIIPKDISTEFKASVAAIVENACLIHDIGNPPFGHFGETAIQNWFNENLLFYLTRAGISKSGNSLMFDDFRYFDGNPQGVRIMNHMLTDGKNGMSNITHSTTLCMIKYPFVAGTGRSRKCGYFYSEKELIENMYSSLNIEKDRRYGFSYILEAADDIAYCLSDISDGIRKNILSIDAFKKMFEKIWTKEYKKDQLLRKYFNTLNKRDATYNLDVSVKWSKFIMDDIAKAYRKNRSTIFSGTSKDVVSLCRESTCVLKILKTIARSKLYREPEVENLELAGLKAISTLLDHFGKLLLLPKDEFAFLVLDDNPAGKDIDIEWRIFNKIGHTAKQTYKFGIITQGKFKKEKDYFNKILTDDELNFKFKKAFKIIPKDLEWYYRAHMIVDYVAGMTDDYALKLYQVLEGIQIKL